MDLEDAILNLTVSCYVQRNTYSFEFVYGVIAAIVIAIGVLGNALSIAILIHAKLSCTTATFLTNLAVYDTIYLVSQMFIYVFTWCEAPDALIKGAYSVHFLNYPVSVISHYGTVYTVVVLSIERYVAVAKPFLAIKVFTPTFARKVMLLVLAVSVLYNVPRYLEHTALWEWHPGTESWHLCTRRTAFQYNPTYTRVYLFYLKLVVDVLVPIVAIAVSNGLLLRAVRRRRCSDLRPHSGSSAESRSDENRLSALVVALTLMLLLSQVMSSLYMLLATSVWDADCPEACYHVHHLTILVQLLNSACNFLFFSMLGRSFRNVVLKTMPLERVTLFFARGSRDEKRCDTEIALHELPRGSKDSQLSGDNAGQDVCSEEADCGLLAPNVLSRVEESPDDQGPAQGLIREKESVSGIEGEKVHHSTNYCEDSKDDTPQTRAGKDTLPKEMPSETRSLLLKNGDISLKQDAERTKTLPEKRTDRSLKEASSLSHGKETSAVATVTRNFYVKNEQNEDVPNQSVPTSPFLRQRHHDEKASPSETALDVEASTEQSCVSENKALVKGLRAGAGTVYGSF